MFADEIHRAIEAGDTETGMMIMKMDEGLDTGPVAMTEKVAIGPDMTAGELHDALSRTGASLMVRAMAALEQGVLELVPQPDDGVTYAAKIAKDETRVDWAGDGADIHNHIRGLSPFPGAFFEVDLGKGPERVKVLRAARVVLDIGVLGVMGVLLALAGWRGAAEVLVDDELAAAR